VVPTLDGWDLRPLISNCVVRGACPQLPRMRVGFARFHIEASIAPFKRVGFFEPLARIAWGLP
jgi:hypothetical protein